MQKTNKKPKRNGTSNCYYLLMKFVVITYDFKQEFCTVKEKVINHLHILITIMGKDTLILYAKIEYVKTIMKSEWNCLNAIEKLKRNHDRGVKAVKFPA